MAFEGMDPVVVKDISVKMDTQAKALASVLTIVQGQVDRARTAWQGPAANTFESGWNSQHKPALVNAHDQLSTMSTLLNSQASAQTVTSDQISGPGGGSGALPVGGGPEVPDGPEPMPLIDKLLWAGTVPFLGAETLALGKLGATGYNAVTTTLGDRAILQQGQRALASAVKAGTMTQSEASTAETALEKSFNESGDTISKGLSGAAEHAFQDGGFPATRAFGALGVAGGVAGLYADYRTIADGPTNQKVAAGVNALGTVAAGIPAVTATLGVEGGLFAADATLGWVPGVGQVLLLGSAAYLAYEQIGWVHDGVNAAAKGVWDGAKWVANAEYQGAKTLVTGAYDLGKDAVHGAENLGNDAVHGVEDLGSGVKNVAKKAFGWL